MHLTCLTAVRRCLPLSAPGLLAALFLLVALLGLDQSQVLAQQGLAPAAGPASGLISLTITAVGDPLPEIQCIDTYTATMYATGLTAPDGLAFDSTGLLYVVEENAGRVTQVGAGGVLTPLVTGLNSPEGITFDEQDTFYVVEDVDGGRVISGTAAGLTGTVATGRDAPEGIIWVDDGSAAGILYLTESNLVEAMAGPSPDPADYRTHVTALPLPAGPPNRLVTTTAVFIPDTPTFPPPSSVEATFWSYAGLALGSDGLLYVSNELAGQTASGEYFDIPYTADSTDSIFTVDPTAPASPLAFTGVLTAPEGLRFSAEDEFPLYVAEEDIDGNGNGRLSRVDSSGVATTFCIGFGSLEDVLLDQKGRLFVTEDSSGRIIMISLPEPDVQPPETEPRVWFPLIFKGS